MGTRLYFLVVGGFFLAMNFLLLRSEFGGRDFAVSIPVETAVTHLFEAADASNLEIRHRGTKIGYCRWAPQPLTADSSGTSAGTNEVLEGMVTGITGYEVDFDGSVTIGELRRLRFHLTLEVDTNFNWVRLQTRLQSRPWKWEVLALAPEETLDLTIAREDEQRQHRFTFEDLRDPSRVIAALGGPLLANSLRLFGLGPDPFQEAREISLGLEWKASTDRQKIGNTFLSVYRLQTRLLDQYRVVVYLLQSGEILRVELPDDIVMVNDELTSL